MLNQKDYSWYVILDRKIESGWEYEEDCADRVIELGEDGILAGMIDENIVGLFEINVNNDKYWLIGGVEK